MADEPSGAGPPQDSDYDGAWKEALRDHLPELLRKYFPAEHAVIDWTCEPEWFDKEVSQVLGQSRRRNREVDVLVKVRLLTGCEQWVLLHLEIQTSYEEDFALRIARYNAGLHWVFEHRAATLVILADLRRNWRPEEDVFQMGTFESRLKFPVCKLIEKLDSEWLNDDSLPVLLARAQVEALRTAGDPDGRYRAKWLLLRGLYDLGYNAEQVREIIRLIDWMMHLRIDLDKRLQEQLNELEEERKMPYMTSFERLAEARGGANVVVTQLTELCGHLGEELTSRVRDLTAAELEQLGRDLLRFKSLDDLQAWLDKGNGATS